MMSYNVTAAYGGEWTFPGLNVAAKTGTAEVGDGTSHAWMTGFLNDAEHPYAFPMPTFRCRGRRWERSRRLPR